MRLRVEFRGALRGSPLHIACSIYYVGRALAGPCARLRSLNISFVGFLTELLREFHLGVLVQGLQLLLLYHNVEMSTKQIYYMSSGLSIKLQRGFAIFVVE